VGWASMIATAATTAARAARAASRRGMGVSV
jgi:hypothetical protein